MYPRLSPPPVFSPARRPRWVPSIALPINTVAPVLSGTATAGQTLSCTTGTWSGSPTSFSYVWKRSDIAQTISGATASTYVLTSTDVGHTITCSVTGINSAGSSLTPGVSNASSSVSAAPLEAASFNLSTGGEIDFTTSIPTPGLTYTFAYLCRQKSWTTGANSATILQVEDASSNPIISINHIPSGHNVEIFYQSPSASSNLAGSFPRTNHLTFVAVVMVENPDGFSPGFYLPATYVYDFNDAEWIVQGQDDINGFGFNDVGYNISNFDDIGNIVWGDTSAADTSLELLTGAIWNAQFTASQVEGLQSHLSQEYWRTVDQANLLHFPRFKGSSVIDYSDNQFNESSRSGITMVSDVVWSTWADDSAAPNISSNVAISGKGSITPAGRKGGVKSITSTAGGAITCAGKKGGKVAGAITVGGSVTPGFRTIVNYLPNGSFEGATLGIRIAGWDVNGFSLTPDIGDDMATDVEPVFGSTNGIIETSSDNTHEGSSAAATKLSVFKSGQTYTASAYVKSPFSDTWELLLGSTADDFALLTFVFTPNVYKRVSVSWIPSADRSSANHGLTLRQTAALSNLVSVDGAMVNDGALVDYVDDRRSGGKGAVNSISVSAGGSITTTGKDSKSSAASVTAGSTITTSRIKASTGSVSISTGGLVVTHSLFDTPNLSSMGARGTTLLFSGSYPRLDNPVFVYYNFPRWLGYSSTQQRGADIVVSAVGNVTPAGNKQARSSTTVSAGSVNVVTDHKNGFGSTTVTAGARTNVLAGRTDSGTSNVTGVGTVTVQGKKSLQNTIAISAIPRINLTSNKGASSSAQISAIARVQIAGVATVAVGDVIGGRVLYLNMSGVYPRLGPPDILITTSPRWVSSAQSSNRTVAIQLSGAGSITTTAKKSTSGSVGVTGAGSITPHGGSNVFEQAVTISGKGSVVTTGRKTTQASTAISSGGSLNLVGAKGAKSYYSELGGMPPMFMLAPGIKITGAGTVVAIGTHVAHSIQITGAGLVLVSVRKNARSFVAISGGGNISPSGALASGQGSAAITGAGSSVSSGRKGGRASVIVTAGLTISATDIKGAKGSLGVTGAGSVQSTYRKSTSNGISISNTGTVTVLDSKRALRSITISAGSTLTVLGFKPNAGVSTVTASTKITTTGFRTTTGIARVSSGTNLSTAGSKQTSSAAQVSGNGSIVLITPNVTFRKFGRITSRVGQTRIRSRVK